MHDLAAFCPLHFFSFPLLPHCHRLTSSPGDITDLPGKTLLTFLQSLITDPFTHVILFTLWWRTQCLTCRCRCSRCVEAEVSGEYQRSGSCSGLILFVARPPPTPPSTHSVSQTPCPHSCGLIWKHSLLPFTLNLFYTTENQRQFKRPLSTELWFFRLFATT